MLRKTKEERNEKGVHEGIGRKEEENAIVWGEKEKRDGVRENAHRRREIM